MELEIIDYSLMAEALKIRVGARIREIRKKKKITQVQLGLLTGIHQQNIFKYEKGIQSMSLEVLEKIAKALRVDLKELF